MKAHRIAKKEEKKKKAQGAKTMRETITQRKAEMFRKWAKVTGSSERTVNEPR
jgi:hypothetical protein